MTKYEEAAAVYESRRCCLRDGSHGCGGTCFSLTAPRYRYNGGPRTPEVRLAEEASAGDAEAAEALRLLAADAEAADAAYKERRRTGLRQLQPGEALCERPDGSFYPAQVEDDGVEVEDYRDAIVCHHGGEWYRQQLVS